ncbi:MAG: SBBP repeat-containing protein, partial [Fimbriimonadales bacterium]
TNNTGQAAYVYVTGYSEAPPGPGSTSTDYTTLRYNGVNALTHDWVTHYAGLGGNAIDRANDIAVAGNGNVYVTGQSMGSANFDYATVKYNKAGQLQHAIRYQLYGEALGLAIAVSCAGNAHVTGHVEASTIDYLSILYTQPVSNVAVTSVTVVRGTYESGDVNSLLTSNDQYLVYKPGPVFVSGEYPIQLVMNGTSPQELPNPNELCFTLEAHTSQPNITQKIELYDWQSASYVIVDERIATTADSVVHAHATYDATRFVQAGTRAVRTKVSYKQVGTIFVYPWFARIDFAGWHVLQ